MKKDFFYYFGGRKNFNFYLVFFGGFALVVMGLCDGKEYLLMMVGALGLSSYFNVKNKEVTDSQSLTSDDVKEQPE